LSGGAVFAICGAGLYDGLRVDVHGNLWLSAGDGVHCHASDGTLLGKVRIPETVANLCFGGPKLNRLFICGTTSLYSVYLNTRAAPRGA
jgi:gluconolactonase